MSDDGDRARLRPRGLIPSPLRRRLYDWRRAARERRWRRFPGIQRLPSHVAALTFDDGPDDDATASVLDALDGVDVKATFFVIGEQVARHPSLAREMVSRGHELGLHGFAHLRQDKLTASQSLADLRRGLEEVETVAGARPRWYRPPYGRMSHGALSACRELRLDPVYWSSWGQDWEAVAAKTIAALACRDLGDGAIVLLHDSARYGQRASAAATAEAIGPIVDFARARGLALVTLSQALAKR